MAWPDDPLPAMQSEVHFGGRRMRCFVDRPSDVWRMFAAAVARHPDGDALIDGHRSLSYRQLADRVEHVATGLVRLGISAGDRIALLLGNRPEFLIALLAAVRLGAIVVPLSTREQTTGLRYMLAHSGARLVLHEAELADRLPAAAELLELRHRLTVGGPVDGALAFEDLPGAAEAPPPHRSDEESTAVILYTCGTTGRPKGAMLTHLNLAHSVMHYALTMGLSAGERSVLAVPATHVTGLVAILLTMVHVAGATVLMPAFRARRFLELAARERITHTLMVPAMYNLCLLEPDFAAFDLAAWRIGAYGGAPMPEATIARLGETRPGLRLMNVYGATETTSPTTLMPAHHTRGRSDSVGLAVPCGEVRIMDETGRELPPGAPGEVWIGGPMVVPGYWREPETTDASFASGFWRSGDIGALDQQGYLRVFDRLKDMINRAGFKVYSPEVENVLCRHPGVIEAAVVARPDPVLGEKIQAFVRPREPSIAADDLRAFCARELADYKVPDFITLCTEPLPRNANGKLIKSALREGALEKAKA